MSEDLVELELDRHARICLCQRHLDRSMQSGSLILLGQRAPLEQEFVDRYQVDAVPLFQPQGCRVRIKDDQPTIMNARGEDMHDRKPSRCSSAHLQSLSPCAPASIRTSGATLFSFDSRLAASVSPAARCSFCALVRMPGFLDDQRRRDERLAVVGVERARDRPANLTKGLT